MEIRFVCGKTRHHTSSTFTPASTSLDALERVQAHNMYTTEKIAFTHPISNAPIEQMWAYLVLLHIICIAKTKHLLLPTVLLGHITYYEMMIAALETNWSRDLVKVTQH